MRSHFYLLDGTALRLSPPVFFGLSGKLANTVKVAIK
jgi:hypothetical protein